MSNGIVHVFMCLFAIYITFLVKCVLKFFAHFCSVIWLLSIQFCGFFIYSGYESFIRYMLCKYFIQVCSLSFYFLNSVF